MGILAQVQVASCTFGVVYGLRVSVRRRPPLTLIAIYCLY